MATTKATLAQRIRDRVANIPAEVTNAMIEGYIEDAASDAKAWLRTSVNLNDVPEEHQGLLVNLGEAYLRSRLSGVGVDFNVTQGEFTVSRGQESDVHTKQVQFLIDRVNTSLRLLGRPCLFKKVFG